MKSKPSIRPTERLCPVGRCIYCGSSEPPLTDEHVLSRGLNGTILLPQSTCDVHKDLTSGIETRLLKRGMFRHPRLVLGMRSYSKRKDRPKSIKVEFVGYGERTFRRKVPIEEAAALLILPTFVPPRAISQKLPLPAVNSIDLAAVDRSEVGTTSMEEMLKKHGAIGINGIVEIPMQDFVRYLCKIAYGFHCARCGEFPREQSPALSLLLGERTDLGNWVGSVPLNTPVTLCPEWNSIEIQDMQSPDGLSLTIVKISLFNFLVPTTYVVVTRVHQV